MGATEIALLGPLSVNGDSAALSPRDRIVLAALAIRPGEVASAERLADALWGEHPPASWHKVVPGCILRLRRLLGADAIETTPYGYRLAVAADQVDVQQFERLLQRGRELLSLGESERAQHTLDAALALWRGRPLIDVDGWEPGRIESARLAELHLETEECRLDAALRAGRHDEVLALAQSAVAEAPLRERRWTLLALAQYQAGCQGEALGTLRRARTVLVAELGLDPGPDIAALEAAILRQDPELTVKPPGPDAVAHCPYLGLFCYDITDADAFFGRDRDVVDCLRRLDSAGILAVVGPSGSGKSSLIRAGVAAALERAGRHPCVVTAGSRPTIILTDTPLVETVLVIDQFEEVFTQCTDQQERIRFFDGLVAEASCCPVVICLRADHLGGLAEYPEIARLVERGVYLLGPMDETGLRAAITGPAESAGLLLEPGLVDLLVREVEGQPGALPLLSHALRRTWERRDGRTMTVAGYQATGGIRGCVAQSAEQLYESLSTRQRQVLRQVLLRLVSAAGDGDPVRTRVPHRLLLTDPEREHIVERLVAARLVTADGEAVQIAHESLARAWPRLSNWLDEDVEGQRIMRHLSASADAWESMGQPDSELYRGARLAHALEWLRTAHPDLTVIESNFIDTSATVRDAELRAIEQQARHQARTRRRTRLLTTGLAALLVAALSAGLLAVRQQHQREVADAAAVVAEASRVDGTSRNAPEVDHALLLALEANRLHDSPDTRAVIADMLSGHPALIRSVSTQQPVQTLGVSPDGTTLMIAEGDSGTASYSTDTLQQLSIHPGVTAWTLDYRPDGQQLLLVGRGSGGLGEDVNQVSAAVSDLQMSALRYLKIGGVRGQWVYARDAAYSADGRFLTAYAQGQNNHSDLIDSAMAVWYVADLDRPIMTVRPIPAFAVALSPDGRWLYVGTREPSLEVVDVATGSVVKSVPLPADIALVPTPANEDNIWTALSDGLEISPDGKTLAVAERNDIVLYDSATLTELRRLRGHNDLVRSLQFSHDGRLLASGSADHTAIVWDTAIGAAVDTLIGHTDAVLGLAFSKDDGTLYTGGLDSHLLVWDLTGRRQLAARIVDGESRTTLAGAAMPSPDGQDVVYAGATATGDNLRFRDVTTGQLTDRVVDPGGDPLAAWLPPDNQSAVTVAGPDLRVHDRRNGRLVTERTVAPSNITALATTHDGFVIVGDRSGGVERVESSTLTSAGRRVQLNHPVTAVAAGRGDTAAALLDDKSYAIANLGEGTVLGRGTFPIKPAAAAISPDGRRLAVGGSSGEVGLFDLDSQEWIAAPAAAHRLLVRGVAFSADGNTIVTSSFDGGVRLWDGNSGAPIAGVQVGREQSPAVATLPDDGHDALIATRDGAVYRLDTRFDHWTAFACAVAGRNLTAQEWQAVFGDQPFHATCPTG